MRTEKSKTVFGYIFVNNLIRQTSNQHLARQWQKDVQKRPLHKCVLRPAAMAGHMGSNKIATRCAALIDLLADGRPRTREAVWQQAAGQLDDDSWGELPQEALACNRRDPYRSVRRQRPLMSVSGGMKRSG
jgi:hypothetical protein